MIFKFGPFPDAPEFTPDDSWILLSEPSPWGFQLRAIPIAVITTAILASLWIVLTPVWHVIATMTFPLPISKFIACLVGVLVTHEIIHTLAHPKVGISDKTLIGFWPSRMFVYAMYVGELSRSRCLTILIMPFFIISIIPLVFAAITQLTSFWIAYISILNGLLACGDILAVSMTIRLLPNDAIIRTKGWSTFWKSRK
jgi:hypothetical protein